MGGQRACVFYRGLYAQRIAYIEPIGTFAFDISLNVVLMAVIGGPGTWQGPLIGAPLVLLVADALRVTFTSEVNRVIFPGGIMGWLARRRRWRNLAELQGIISLPKMPISVMPNRTLTSPSHIRSSFSRFAQHLSADQQPFAPTIWPDCRLRLRCGRGGYSAEIAKINVLGMPAP